MKTCNKCGLIKNKSEFHISKRSDRPNGKKYKISSNCKECSNEIARFRYSEGVTYSDTRRKYSRSEKGIELLAAASKRHYESVKGRACHLFNGAKRRSHKWPVFDIDVEFIEKKLTSGFCEVTGLPFQFSTPGNSHKNPFAPSIDRIDNSKGYIKSNVRIVLWCVNLMHGEMNDEQMVEMCKAVVKGLSK